MRHVQLLGTLVLLGCAGCVPGNAPQPRNPASNWIGQTCEVQFRRDALGAAAPNGIPPEIGSYNGAATHLAGTLRNAQPDCIVLSDGRSEFVIPMNAVLYLKFGTFVPPGSATPQP